MLSKSMLAFMMFNAVNSVVGLNEVYVSFEANEEQWHRRKESNDGILQVRDELTQPLTQEELKELENAAGMALYDIGTHNYGRALRIERELSEAEIQNLADQLNTVSWVCYARTDNPAKYARHDDPPSNPAADWRQPAYWQRIDIKNDMPKCEEIRQGRPSSRHTLNQYKENFCAAPQSCQPK